MKTKNKGGVVANSIKFNRHSGKIVHILYMDHILYRNSNPILYGEPDIRETIGWIVRENKQAIWILWDKPVKPLPYQRISLEYSGLIILKRTILKMKKLD